MMAAHQDLTYLYQEPHKLTGWWIPLIDVDEENGCMWVIPGSHKNGLYVRFGMKGYTPHYEIFKEPD